MSDINKEKEYYKSKFNFNPESGNFTWKLRCGDEFENLTRGDKSFNGKYAGKEAGCKDPDGYIRININGEYIRAHRLVHLFMTGDWPEDEIDHINGNTSDNRWENLRLVNQKENNKNAKIQKNNISGIRGVNWSKNEKKWLVRIHDNNGKRICLGRFNDFFEACCRRKSAELQYNYHPNHGRKSEVV